MKKIIINAFSVLLLTFLVVESTCMAQVGKEIKIENKVWASPYKSQGPANRCFIFSVTSLFESELYRLYGEKHELSQMFFQYYSNIEKVQYCIRSRVENSFTGGGHFQDVINVIHKYGAVPLKDYEGTLDEKLVNNYVEQYPQLKNTFIPSIFKIGQQGDLNIKYNNGFPEAPWINELTALMDSNMGQPPKQVIVNQKKYNPIEYAKEVLKIPLDDYVKITSYSYIPFYKSGELLVKDNWSHANDFYSLPVDDFIELIDHAIKNGYSMAVDVDVTEKIYMDALNYADYKEEKIIDQDVRDELFDNWMTSDIHLFHLIGIAKDDTDKNYYYIKESVGYEMGFNPPEFYSENYFRAKALGIMLHKDGIPSNIKKKLQIN